MDLESLVGCSTRHTFFILAAKPLSPFAESLITEATVKFQGLLPEDPRSFARRHDGLRFSCKFLQCTRRAILSLTSDFGIARVQNREATPRQVAFFPDNMPFMSLVFSERNDRSNFFRSAQYVDSGFKLLRARPRARARAMISGHLRCACSISCILFLHFKYTQGVWI